MFEGRLSENDGAQPGVTAQRPQLSRVVLAHAPRQPGSWLTWDVGQMKAVALIFVVLLLGRSLAVAAPSLVLNTKVVGSGIIRDFGEFRAVVVEAQLTNLGAKEIAFTIMSCSWSDSFVVDPSTRFEIQSCECKRNAPETAYLRPGESLVFVFPVVVPAETGEIRFRIGFSTVPEMFKVERETSEMIWAAPIFLPGVSGDTIKYRYEKNKRPNQALQHNDPSCHVPCVRTYRASRGRG